MSSIENLVVDSPRGKSVLVNAYRCCDLSLLPSGAKEKLAFALEQEWELRGRPEDPAVVNEIVLQVLEGWRPEFDAAPLYRDFDDAYTPRSAVARVITMTSLESHYLIPRTGTDSFGNLTLSTFADVVERDSEYAVTDGVPNSDALVLKPRIRLCRKDDHAFVTDLAAWNDLADTRLGNLADLAASQLGLAFGQGERLALISVQPEAFGADTKMRRPVVFDALDHWWWICWQTDPPHLGHTISLEELDAGRVKPGGAEWVINDAEVDTEIGAEARDLGTTSRCTVPSDPRCNQRSWELFRDSFST